MMHMELISGLNSLRQNYSSGLIKFGSVAMNNIPNPNEININQLQITNEHIKTVAENEFKRLNHIISKILIYNKYFNSHNINVGVLGIWVLI